MLLRIIRNGKLLETNAPIVDARDYKSFLDGNLKGDKFIVFSSKGDLHFEYSDGKIWKHQWKRGRGLPKFVALKSSETEFILPVMFFNW